MIHHLLHALKVIRTMAKLKISSAMMYRASFWSAFCADLTLFSLQLVFFGVVAKNGTIGDWTVWHLTVFTGSFVALDGLFMATYFFGVLSLPEKIRTGTLDLVIVKPVGALWFVSFGELDIGSFALCGIGLIITGVGAAQLGVLTLPNCLRFVAALLLMYLLLYSISLCIRCAAFWLTKVDALQDVENTLMDMSFRLPAPAIHGAWRVLLFVILPYGLIANLPSLAMFGQMRPVYWLLCTVVTAFFFGLALLLWNRGMKRYDSSSA